MPTNNIAGVVSTALIILKSDTNNFTANTTVTGSIRILNDALISSVDATPADNDFTVTIAGQTVTVTGDTDVNTTTAALVTALNASVLSRFAEITWSDEGSGIIGAFVDAGGTSFDAALSVSGVGSGGITNFTIASTINMTNAVIVTVSPGFVDFQGSFGADRLVTFDSVDANKKRKRWNWFSFTGPNTSNTMKHCLFKNADLGGGLISQGHTPVEGKFQHLLAYNGGGMPFGRTDASSGTQVVSDIAAINCSVVFANITAGGSKTWKRLFIDSALSWGAFQKTGTIAGLASWNMISTHNFAMSTGETATLTDFWLQDGTIDGVQNSGAGTLNLTGYSMNRFRIGANNSSSGAMNITSGDMVLCSFFSGAGFFEAAGILIADDNYLEANNEADWGNIDTTIDASSDPSQYDSRVTRTNARSTRKFPLTFSSIVVTNIGSNSFDVAVNTGQLAKIRIRIGVITKVYTMSTDWSVPQFVIPSGGSAEIIVEQVLSDFSASGEKYSLSHTIKVVNLQSETTYRWVIEALSSSNEWFPISEEQTTSTTSPIDTTNPTWDDGGPGTDSGLVATDANTVGEVNLSWNTPLDETAVEGVQLFFSTVSGAQAITDGVKRIIPSNITSIRLGGLTNDTEHFFIVRALDKAGNTTSETIGITATPTGLGVPVPTPGALQAFLTAE